MARGMDRVFRTVVDRTRSRLDLPALRTPFRIRRRPEGTGQPSPKLFADRKPKAATRVSRADRRGSCSYGDGRSRRARLMSPAWRERLRVRAAYNRATSVPGSKVSSVSGAWAGLRRCHVDLFRRSMRLPWVNPWPSAWPRGPRAWRTVTPSGGMDGG